MHKTVCNSWAKYFSFLPQEAPQPINPHTPTPILLADLAQLTTNKTSPPQKKTFGQSHRTLLPSTSSSQRRKKSLQVPGCSAPGNRNRSQQKREERYSKNLRIRRSHSQSKEGKLGDFNGRIICPFNFYRPSKTKKLVRQGSSSLSMRTEVSSRRSVASEYKWLKVTALSPSSTQYPETNEQKKYYTRKIVASKPWNRQASCKHKIITEPSAPPTDDFKAWETNQLPFEFQQPIC